MSTHLSFNELREALQMEVDRYSKVFIKEVQSLANIRLLVTS